MAPDRWSIVPIKPWTKWQFIQRGPQPQETAQIAPFQTLFCKVFPIPASAIPPQNPWTHSWYWMRHRSEMWRLVSKWCNIFKGISQFAIWKLTFDTAAVHNLYPPLKFPQNWTSGEPFFRIWRKLTLSLHSGMLATWRPITTNNPLNLLDLINFTLEAPSARPHNQDPYNDVYKVELCLHPLPVLTKYNLKITVKIFFTQCSRRSKHIFTGGTGVDWMIKTITLVEWQSYAIVVFVRFALG